MGVAFKWLCNVLQWCLDCLHATRKHIVTTLAYLTLRAYGLKIAYGEVLAGTFDNRKPTPLDLENAQDLDTLLRLSGEAVENAGNRRAVVTDKCKTLLTLGSLLLATIGLFLPKYLAFDLIWLRALSGIAVAVLFNAVVILLIFFDVGQDMEVSLDETDIPLNESNLKKSLLNRRLQCYAAAENRTDYLVDLYRAARFCFLTSLSIVSVLVFTNSISNPADQASRMVNELRSDPHLTNLLRGPKGDEGPRGDQGVEGGKGQKGDKGDKGDRGADSNPDDVVNRLIIDERFRAIIEKALAPHNKTNPQQ
jgi:hypothetical protein